MPDNGSGIPIGGTQPDSPYGGWAVSSVGGSTPIDPPTLPGDSFANITQTLGDPERAGTVGGDITVPNIDGDLGSIEQTRNRSLLLAEARRVGSDINSHSPDNYRYRGHRESVKLNVTIQNILTMCASLYLTLKDSNDDIKDTENNDMYLTETELINYYHVLVQMQFKEWLLLKDQDRNWYG